MASHRDAALVERGGMLPHFDVDDVRGRRISYASLWQRRNAVVVFVRPHAPAAADRILDRLAARGAEFGALEAEVVVTRESVDALSGPAALVADRWGEIVYLVRPESESGLPDADELLEWLRYVQSRCPECEGEAR